MAYGQQSQGIGLAITKPRPKSHRKFVGRTKKACARPANLTQLHQLCQEEWANIHPTYCGKLVEGHLGFRIDNNKSKIKDRVAAAYDECKSV